MTARRLAADADPATGKLGELVADGGVKVEEPGTEATGDRVAYVGATDTFKLTGHTILETPQMIFTESPGSGPKPGAKEVCRARAVRVQAQAGNLEAGRRIAEATVT